jgi:hypothetical protein
VIGANDPTLESSLDGEVPTSYPTILEQVQLYPGDGDRVGLVLLNGGINDCNVRTILSPTATESELLKLASQHCNTDMAQLLGEILTTFPLATVCVLGYYQLLSAESLADVDRALLDAALLAFGLPGGIVAALGIDELDAIAARCAAWTAAANQQLALAASQVASVHSRRIVFVDPGFTAANAVLTPESLLFSLNGDLSPQDSVAAARKGVCQSAGARTDEYICERASIGHPNSAGAAKIAGALLAALQL